MTYTGAMVLPQNAVMMLEEEMRYLEGGKVTTQKGTAANLKKKANRLMWAWGVLATGFSLEALALVETIVGAGAAGVGAAHCWYAASQYRNAYNYFSVKKGKGYYMKTITSGPIVTGVKYGKS